MKLIYNLILIIISLVFIFPLFAKSCTRPAYIKPADMLVQKATRKLQKKYGLELIAVKRGMLGCVKLIGPQFQIYKKLTKDQARRLVVNCVEDLLEEINKDEKIRPYLEVYPFDPKHVEVVIFLYTSNGDRFYHPDLAVVSADGGTIIYSTNDPENKYGYKSRETETFEEALKILKEQEGSCQHDPAVLKKESE